MDVRQPVTLSTSTVLVVDSNPASCRVTADICRMLGFKSVIRATDPAQTFALVRKNGVSLVICDLVMQPIDGLGLTRLIRQAPDSPEPALPIIMLTRAAEASRVAEARDAGVTEFVAKPVAPKTLLSRVVHILENPRPFMRAGAYVGPDRRRRTAPFRPPDRRAGDPPDGQDESWVVDE